MTAPHIVDPHGLLGEALAEASPDLMRSLLQDVINALPSADADAVAGGLTPFFRSGGSESRPVARGRGQGDWSDHDEQQEASHPRAGRP